MGFFNSTVRQSSHLTKGFSLDLYHKGQCVACPLKGQRGGCMKPSGSKGPEVYFLGEAPGRTEVEEGRQFVGASGRLLRSKLPKKWEPRIRWNNTVRCRPTMPGGKKDRQPSVIEMECCRPSVVEDIERTKPIAVFGFGGTPLTWATGQTGIAKWRGRVTPVKIGSHTCWFFPMYHPAYVARTINPKARGVNDYGSEIEFVFTLDLQRAFALLGELPDPVVYDRDMALRGIDFVTGCRGEQDVDKVVRFLMELYNEKVVGLDYETNGLQPYREGTKILTVALSAKNRSMAFPIDHSKSQFTQAQKRKVLNAYKLFLKKAKCRKVVHNLPFELEWTGVKLDEDLIHGTRWECTQTQAYILDERQGRNKPGCLSLKFLCIQYFGLDFKNLNPVDRQDLDNTPLDEVLRYNVVDARFHRLLFLKQRRRLIDEGLTEQYQHNLRRLPTLALTKIQGVPISQRQVSKFHDLYSQKVEEAESELAKTAGVKRFQQQKGKPFQASSNADVLYLLADVLGLDLEEDQDGKRSVDAVALQRIKHPVAALLLKYRNAAKMLSTYVLPVREGAVHLYPGSVVHPAIRTTTTETNRTSSEDPNIQNWPKRKNKEIRRQAKGKKGYRFVSFDYAGIQARNVAMESRDKALVKAFWHRYDIHSDWMERIVKIYPSWIPKGLDKASKKAFRHRAKNEFVFPSFFGAQSYSISKSLGIPEKAVQKLLDEFWSMFPDIHNWHKKIHRDYREFGYVTGLSGFRRRAPISPTQLINAPVQADESTIVMDAMCRLSEMQDPRYQSCLMVHDDLTFVWHENEIDNNAEVVITAMLDTSYAWAKIVPLGVEMQVGKNWADQEPVGEFFSDTWQGKLTS